MEPPEDIRKLNEQVKELDLKIEGAIRIEAFAQAGEWKREQDALLKKLNQRKMRLERRTQPKRKWLRKMTSQAWLRCGPKIPVSKLEEKRK